MKLSQHAKVRSKQRGISSKIIKFVESYGESIPRPGNVWELRINKIDIKKAIEFHQQQIILNKKMIELIEKSSNVSVIVNGHQDQVITTFHQK